MLAYLTGVRVLRVWGAPGDGDNSNCIMIVISGLKDQSDRERYSTNNHNNVSNVSGFCSDWLGFANNFIWMSTELIVWLIVFWLTSNNCIRLTNFGDLFVFVALSPCMVGGWGWGPDINHISAWGHSVNSISPLCKNPPCLPRFWNKGISYV